MTATLNWPTHRGTATAFPLAAFGLSAFFYTMIASFAFPSDTAGFLLLLSLATSILVLVSIPFLHVVDHQHGAGYATLPTTERPKPGRRDSNRLHRTKSDGSKHSRSSFPAPEPSKYSFPLVGAIEMRLFSDQPFPANDPEQGHDSETSSLLSAPGDIVETEDDAQSHTTQRSHKIDVTGLALLPRVEFWQLWILLGLLTGVGLMTIK